MSGGDGAQKRVVIADDDTDIRSLISIAIGRAHLDLVAAVANGDAAWLAIQEHRPELVVLDVSMPGMTGLEVCRLLRSDAAFAGMRVVLLSAAVDDQSRAAGYAAGADEFLAKPFSPRELAARLAVIAEGEAIA